MGARADAEIFLGSVLQSRALQVRGGGEREAHVSSVCHDRPSSPTVFPR